MRESENMCLSTSFREERTLLENTRFIEVSPVNENFQPLGRRHFIERSAIVRSEIQRWLDSKGAQEIHPVIRMLLFNGLWENFYSPQRGLRYSVFTLILYFFETNDAPMELRKEFWNWILPTPQVTAGYQSEDHPYIHLFFDVCGLDPVLLARCGAFDKIEGGYSYYYDGSVSVVWRVYNIWQSLGWMIEDTNASAQSEPEYSD